MKKKLKFKTVEIVTICESCSTLRACPVLPMDLATKINAVSFPFISERKKIDDVLALLGDRKEQVDKMLDKDAQVKAAEAFNEDVKKANRSFVEIEFEPVKLSEFIGVDISGVKEIPHQQFGLLKHNYRDAYFELISLQVIQ